VTPLRTAAVVPSYNHERWLGEALDSLLAQTRPLDQIVVVDDGSTDGSREILARYRRHGVRVVEQPNRGAHAALGRGIDETDADLLFLLNSDDRFAPDRVARMAHLFEEEEIAFAGSWIRVIDEAGKTLGVKEGWRTMPPWVLPRAERSVLPLDDARFSLLAENYLSTTSNFVFRRLVWGRHGPFRALRYAHDWDFALRAGLAEGVRLVPEALVDYRVHRRNTIREDRPSMELEVLWVLASNLPAWTEMVIGQPGPGIDAPALLLRIGHSIQTFGKDHVLSSLMSLAAAGPAGRAALERLLDPGDPLRLALKSEWEPPGSNG
jgi:glycosyltransferase involved in cell wall biosynthesis